MTTDPGAPDTPAFETERLMARLLSPGHEPLLQAVFEDARDHFQRTTGRASPDPDTAGREIRACATTPGRAVALLTHRESGEPVAVLGWWEGNPEAEVALLGIVLVVPEHRGKGLARETVAGLEGWLAEREIRRLRTAVGATDFSTHALLRALGFAEMSIRDHTALGMAGVNLALFEKPLG
ncbi:hypothetical protein BH23GEM7_BH23GEM7_35090 [soil metagenome]